MHHPSKKCIIFHGKTNKKKKCIVPAAAVGDVGDVGRDLGRIYSLAEITWTPSSRETLRLRNRPRRTRFSWNSWKNNFYLKQYTQFLFFLFFAITRLNLKLKPSLWFNSAIFFITMSNRFYRLLLIMRLPSYHHYPSTLLIIIPTT